MISLALYTLRAMGVQLSLDKGERGARIQWIGAKLEMRETTLTLGIPARMAREVVTTLEEWKSKGMVPMRRVAGRHRTPLLDGWRSKTYSMVRSRLLCSAG